MRTTSSRMEIISSPLRLNITTIVKSQATKVIGVTLGMNSFSRSHTTGPATCSEFECWCSLLTTSLSFLWNRSLRRCKNSSL